MQRPLPGEKLPPTQLGVVDNVINIAAYPCGDTMHMRLGLNPNGITGIGAITGVAAIGCLWARNVVAFSIFLWVNYPLDNADGYVARKYGLVSSFGDAFDHGKDFLVAVGLAWVAFTRLHAAQYPRTLILMVLAILISLANSGCQDRVRDKMRRTQCYDDVAETTQTLQTLSYVQKMCLGNPEQTIRFTRWCGNGMMMLVVWIGFVYMCVHGASMVRQHQHI